MTDALWRIGPPLRDWWSRANLTVLRRESGGRISVGAAGGQKTSQRPRQGCEGPIVVELFPAAAGEPALGALLGALGTGAVDLRGPLGGVGKHDDLVVTDLSEAARDGQIVLVAPHPVHELADAERRQEGRVARQHTEIALAAGNDDLVDGLGDDLTRRRG